MNLTVNQLKFNAYYNYQHNKNNTTPTFKALSTIAKKNSLALKCAAALGAAGIAINNTFYINNENRKMKDFTKEQMNAILQKKYETYEKEHASITEKELALRFLTSKYTQNVPLSEVSATAFELFELRTCPWEMDEKVCYYEDFFHEWGSLDENGKKKKKKAKDIPMDYFCGNFEWIWDILRLKTPENNKENIVDGLRKEGIELDPEKTVFEQLDIFADALAKTKFEQWNR